MSTLAARLFTYVQGAAFYEELIRDALELLPPGDGRRLVDVGCGPGLLTRLARARGYEAVGLDSDPAMIAAARRSVTPTGGGVEFRLVAPDRPSSIPVADVVVAASLLAVSDDPGALLRRLWSAVRPEGTLLIVEPSTSMSPENARRLAATRPLGRRAHVLQMWARARGGRSIDVARCLRGLDEVAVATSTPLLAGLVDAWTVVKAA